MLMRLATLFVLFMLFLGTASAQDPARRAEQPIFIDLAGAEVSVTGRSASDRLIAKAVAEGVVRVIVELSLPMQPANDLSAAAAAEQARGLRAAQDRVAARVLGRSASDASVTRFETIPFVSLFVTAAEVQRLLQDPEVVSVQEDVPFSPTLNQSIARINADDVWMAGYAGVGTSVAIIDTGVDSTHPMLAGRVVSEACFSTQLTHYQIYSLCPGGAKVAIGPGTGANCTSAAGCIHGTHVAGIAAGGQTSRLRGGVARRAGIIAIQVFSRFENQEDCFELAPCLLAFNTDVLKGVERAYQISAHRRVAAVNLSLGGGYFYNFPCDLVQPALATVIKSLREAGVATVIASGNAGVNGGMTPPGCIGAAIAVGSTLDTEDELSAFSNHAAQVRLLAPGSNITSAVPGGGYQILNGTSMATPHVAGAFALLKDVYEDATVDDISAALECTGVPVERAGIIRPRIDVDAARAFLLAPPTQQRLFSFDNASDGAAWTRLMGRYNVLNGLFIANHTPGWKIASIGNCNENLTVEARMRRLGPDLNWNSGIFFKATLNQQGKIFSGYFAGFNGYNGDTVFLNRLHGFNLNASYGGWAHVLCEVHPDFNPAGFNTLKVISEAGHHRVIFNGAEVCNVSDTTFGVGRVAIASYFPDTSTGHAFQVDRVSIVPNEVVPPVAATAQLGDGPN